MTSASSQQAANSDEQHSIPEVGPSGPKTWVRGLLTGVWIGLMIGAFAGYRLGQAFPERFPGVYVMLALCGLSVISGILQAFVRPSQQEITARAVRWSRRISPRTARTLKIIGLPFFGLGFICMFLRYWTRSDAVFLIAFCLLGVGASVLFPAALAEKPSSVSAVDWERLRKAE